MNTACPVCGCSAYGKVACLTCGKLVCWTCAVAWWDLGDVYHRQCKPCLREGGQNIQAAMQAA